VHLKSAGGSTPDGNDYDRDIVIVSTTRMKKVYVSYHELLGKPLHTSIALVHRQREKAPTVLNFVKALRKAAS
jgi:hypothetical protein